jgi:4-hydroxybenzoate polyprenyltransferase
MPFALIGFFLALQVSEFAFNWQLLVFVLLCMVFARNAAMGFNRYLDRDIDIANPRTAQVREIPKGVITAKNALLFVIINCLLFIITTYFINPLCMLLSPVALLVVLGYSYTKRFTALCHLVLGLGLALAPLGAFLAVTGQFYVAPLFFSLTVLFWVAGFDIIYSLQDEEFDKTLKLHSIPVLMGKERALKLSRILHVITAGFVIVAGFYLPNIHFLYWIACAFFVSLLVYQHTLIKPNDLSKVNLAFFTTNGIASAVFAVLVLGSFYLG